MNLTAVKKLTAEKKLISRKMIIDTHFHAATVISHGAEIEPSLVGLKTGIDIGSIHSDLPVRAEILKNAPHIYIAGGMGPWEVGENEAPKTLDEIKKELDILKNHIKNHNVSFIGETGLDNYYKYGTVETQEYLFREMLNLSYSLKLPVLIHNREADKQVIYDLKNIKHHHTGIIHCFSGNLELMKTAVSEGFYISYAGNITYKSNNSLRETLKHVPMDRLLVETDAPFLPPVPLRGTVNVPLNVSYVYSCISQFLDITIEKLQEQIYSNFTALCSGIGRPLLKKKQVSNK